MIPPLAPPFPRWGTGRIAMTRVRLQVIRRHRNGDAPAAGAKAGIAVDPRNLITIRSRWSILLVNRGKAAGND
jgi:hypothetical protein